MSAAGIFVRFSGGGSDCGWVLLFLLWIGIDVSTSHPDHSTLVGECGGEASGESGGFSSS